MKCARCLSVCLEDDYYCPSCRCPLQVREAFTPVQRRRRIAASMGLAFAAIGTCIAPLVVHAYFPQMLSEAVSLGALPFAACGAGLGWLLGYALGAFAFEMDVREAAVAQRATPRQRRIVELWPWRS